RLHQSRCGTERGSDRAHGQTRQHLLDQTHALLDFTDANPDAGIDVSIIEHGNIEFELVIRRIGQYLARIEGAAARAPYISAGAKPARKLKRENTGRGGTVLERGRI